MDGQLLNNKVKPDHQGQREPAPGAKQVLRVPAAASGRLLSCLECHLCSGGALTSGHQLSYVVLHNRAAPGGWQPALLRSIAQQSEKQVCSCAFRPLHPGLRTDAQPVGDHHGLPRSAADLLCRPRGPGVCAGRVLLQGPVPAGPPNFQPIWVIKRVFQPTEELRCLLPDHIGLPVVQHCQYHRSQVRQ